MNDCPTLSIIIPLLNEEAVVGESYARIKQELDALGETYEMIFVDDGSSDGSRGILTAISLTDPRVRIVALSRNFGHEVATTAGLQHARGQAAIIIDADLQDPPELMKEFVARWREGYQVVYGVRQRREGEGPFKKASAYLFYRLMGLIGDRPIPANTGDFRLIDRRIIDVYKEMPEDLRFFRGLISWIGFKQIGIPFVRRPRHAGTSKYRPARLLRLAFDTITAFSTLPALVITLLAGGIAFASALFIGLTLLLWLVGVVRLEGWSWAALGFLLLWNVQFLCLAVLGEYIVRMHRQTQRRPLFVVESVIEGGKARET